MKLLESVKGLLKAVLGEAFDQVKQDALARVVAGSHLKSPDSLPAAAKALIDSPAGVFANDHARDKARAALEAVAGAPSPKATAQPAASPAKGKKDGPVHGDPPAKAGIATEYRREPGGTWTRYQKGLATHVLTGDEIKDLEQKYTGSLFAQGLQATQHDHVFALSLAEYPPAKGTTPYPPDAGSPPANPVQATDPAEPETSAALGNPGTTSDPDFDPIGDEPEVEEGPESEKPDTPETTNSGPPANETTPPQV